MVTNNFGTLKSTLAGDRVVFVVQGRLFDDKFVLLPDIRTIINTIVVAMDGMLDKLKSVPRWLRTTNVRCPLVQNQETGELRLPYSFYDHVVDREHVHNAQKECYDAVEVLMGRLKTTAQKYRFCIVYTYNGAT